MDVGRGELARLTAAKAAANFPLRIIPFFLFVLVDAFDTTTARLTLIIGLAEMTGLGTLLIRGRLDPGREQRFLVASMVCTALAGLVALTGRLSMFAVAFVLVIAGTSLVTVAGHTWLSHRVSFERRGFAIGVFETSWALALLVGAPLAAFVIDRFGWRAPFVVVSMFAAVMAVVMAGLEGPGGLRVSASGAVESVAIPLGRPAVKLIAMSSAIATAGLSTIVIVGTWLTDEFGVSTGQVGTVAFAFGAAEILSSSGSAALSDRLGKARTATAALIAVLVGLSTMVGSGSSLMVAVIGLGLFFTGFEYAIVTSFSIVSEANPLARGRALATNNAASTVARGAGAIAAGVLYEAAGIAGPAVLSAVAAVVALGLLVTSARG